MKKLALIWLALTIPACAFGKLEDAAEEIEQTLDDLHTAECIRGCTDTGELCLNDANGLCVDQCEVDEDACDSAKDSCIDSGAEDCSVYTDSAYYNCMEIVRDQCDADCNGMASNCNQACADIAQDCLTANADCVADCVQELEDSLGDISL